MIIIDNDNFLLIICEYCYSYCLTITNIQFKNNTIFHILILCKVPLEKHYNQFDLKISI